VLKLAAAGFNVFMVGPTGSGKSHIGEQVARALGRPFGLINGTAGTTEVELFGRGYPNTTTGEHHYWPSEFVTLYETGGLFLADEIDAMDPNLLLKLNGAIAQGYCTIPHRPAKPRAVRDPGFVFMATANTWGTGANRSYCGRNQLDEATLDRLRCATVEVDYDPDLERACACPDADLYAVLSGWRDAIMRGQFRRILSTRFVAGAYKLKSLGYTDAEIGRKLTGGWPDREARAVLGPGG
jgi:cobaltochelatase CobS